MLVIAILVVGVFFGYQKMVGGAQAAYQICLDEATVSPEEFARYTCGLKREMYEELARCIIVAQEQSNITAFLYSPLGVKSKVTVLIETHNNECTQSVVKIPREGLYLEN